MCVCVCACVRACVRARVCVCDIVLLESASHHHSTDGACCNAPLPECVREQLAEMKAGFNLLAPQGLLAPFTADELEVIISGVRTIDVDLLQSRTTYSGYSQTSSVVQWLWETLREYPEVRMYSIVYTYVCISVGVYI